MSDFITLACPSCGGSLTLNSNQHEYTCDYCGQNHQVRKEDIEAFGRCPICNRNDKVEKIAHIAKGNQSILKEIIDKPEKPELILESESDGLYFLFLIVSAFSLFVFIVVILIQILSTASSDNISDSTSWFANGCCLTPFVGVFLFFLIGTLICRQRIKKNKNINYDNRMIYKIDLIKWEKQMSIWNQVYYCRRDDIIFIPGERRHAPVEEIRDFINKNAQQE